MKQFIRKSVMGFGDSIATLKVIDGMYHISFSYGALDQIFLTEKEAYGWLNHYDFKEEKMETKYFLDGEEVSLEFLDGCSKGSMHTAEPVAFDGSEIIDGFLTLWFYTIEK